MEHIVESLVADPVVIWPAVPDVAGLARLNPGLSVRRVTDRHGSEILVYAGSGQDAVAIDLAAQAGDDFLIALTERNRDWVVSETDAGPLQAGPLRIERTPGGSLLIRPRSAAADAAIARFGRACQLVDPKSHDQRAYVDQIMRVVKSWGMLRPGGAIWEVDFAYLPERHVYRTDGSRKSTREYWETLPIGTVSYIDRGDLSIDVHYERARRIVADGSLYAVVADVRLGGARIFRASGIETVNADTCIPEMPWFAIPVPTAPLS